MDSKPEPVVPGAKVERYPALKNGRVVGYVLSSADFTVLYSSEGKRLGSYMWIEPSIALRIDEYIHRGILNVNGVKIEYARLVEDIPWPLLYVVKSVRDYSKWVIDKHGDELRNKTIMVNFSGGKDSASVLRTVVEISKLLEGVNVYAVYSHVSFLEAVRNIDFAIRAAEKIGAEIEVVEADRDLMKKRLLEEGLPFRGRRWCTYMKLRPIKKLKKKRRPHIIADGDRMTEAFKRFYRLYHMSPKSPRLYSGGRFRPIYVWTLLDVVKVVRESGVVHPDYLDGLPRVACTFCPYKSLHELGDNAFRLVEDPGLIEAAMKTSYRRLYEQEGIPWDEFRSQHLWRFHPVLAKKLYLAKKHLMSKELEELHAAKVEEMYRSLWVEELPKAPVINPDKAVEAIASIVLRAYREAVDLAEEATRIVRAEKTQALDDKEV
ncbi:phosphoadenosine phosphosulfate reductase family protein [Pyrofollis japonicus]|uniref:phosphoadenosine phosphosulfate reductase family protein n=1 Tax=Pyrofollis japonicus TaxID=3060460 RepID=UPI00295C10F4|nr:phosphoadenosine phosphosulfate reductase family protein [Pyrofollis japonicus]